MVGRSSVVCLTYFRVCSHSCWSGSGCVSRIFACVHIPVDGPRRSRVGYPFWSVSGGFVQCIVVRGFHVSELSMKGP